MGGTPTKGKGFGITWIRAHVDYKGDDCLIWPLDRTIGYGSLSFNGKIYIAHRFMCKLAHGESPTPKHQATHTCGRGEEGCCNPRHLEWKTNGENQLDRRKHGTTNAVRIGRLTETDVAQMVALRPEKTEIELARMFGVTRSTVRYRIKQAANRTAVG